MRMAITMTDVSAFIIDTAFNNHEIIGDSVSCNRMMIDLYRPIIRSFMVFYCQQSTVNRQQSIVGSCHPDFDYIDFSLQR